MARWLSDARVLEFYEGRDNPFDYAKVVDTFAERARGTEKIEPYFILYDGVPIGYIQYYELTDEERTAYPFGADDRVHGIDTFIGEPERWNRGLGGQALSLVLDRLFREHGATHVVVAPTSLNQRAIRAYEKLGFRKIELLPEHELHEGVYRDVWLMVLAKTDLSAAG